MEFLLDPAAWGSPVGLGLLFFLAGVGAGVFFWGVSHVIKGDKKDDKRT